MRHFGGRGSKGGYNPEIHTWLRFLYDAPTHQVSSSFVQLFRSYCDDKIETNTHPQTNGFHQKHAYQAVDTTLVEKQFSSFHVWTSILLQTASARCSGPSCLQPAGAKFKATNWNTGIHFCSIFQCQPEYAQTLTEVSSRVATISIHAVLTKFFVVGNF